MCLCECHPQTKFVFNPRGWRRIVDAVAIKLVNEMLEINTLTLDCCFKSANNKRNARTCLKQTVTCMSRLVYCYSFH